MRIQKEYCKTILILLFLLISRQNFASPYFGAAYSQVLIAREPESLHGYQFLINYDPDCLKWRQFNLYFDAGVSHLWITNRPYYTSLNIYTISPILRYAFRKRGPFSPYLELSVGFAWFNHTHIDDRNLGMHPAFQDRFGGGFYLGSKQQFSLGAHVVHYSNACLSAHNNGISIPLEIDIGYRFSLG